MAGIDKAAIAFSIAITAIGVGIAFAGDSIDYSPTVSSPAMSNTSEVSSEPSETKSDPFADLADKVREENMMAEEEPMEETMMAEEEPMEETMMAEEETMMAEEEPMEETMMAESAGPQTFTVDMPEGTSSPGCETSNACYLPADITINVGDTIEWINVDTAAHTVTAGSPADGPSGVFDSSLVMASAAYSFTFEEAGNYDYFCMVHPWMVGSVTVN
jgi:plastocyanin